MSLKIFALITVIFVINIFFCDPVLAGNGSGTVKLIYTHALDVVLFDIGSHNDKPACSTAGNEWALSLATETGKAMYALLLSAAAQSKNVDVLGDNTCSAWFDRENPLYVRVVY